MATIPTASTLFGEEWEGFEVHTFPIRDGQGYYISHTVDNTRTVEVHHEIILIWSDGGQERTTVESEQELKLWTEHLR